MSKYWNQEGQYQAEFNQLSDELMPRSGKADSLAGEIIRSVNRLYYDAFNNGFCNNTSGAINFVDKHLVPLFPADAALSNAVGTIRPCTNTDGYSDVTKAVENALDLLVDRAVEAIRTYPDLRRMPTYDMFDLQEDEPDYDDLYRESYNDFDPEDDDDY